MSKLWCHNYICWQIIIEIVVVNYDLFDIHGIVVMSQIKFIPTPSWLVYFVLKAQPFFINYATTGTLVEVNFLWKDVTNLLFFIWHDGNVRVFRIFVFVKSIVAIGATLR